ncbi:nascent polypeptide-associated complex protein [Desulfurococcus amylolyticus]|uniref:Nascent polypeptide-associated complex protein n=1 Tax=Desulfurococcus amylolyticus DSM 16532 TaxID=768672 RepID=I3XTK1_DESAM|nr:Nascent polypeptide associated complex NAC [Desulfurococcus amylolyticus DSM 16532]
MFASNPRELKRLLKKMGIDVEELTGVKRVEIVLEDKKILVKEPQVLVFKAGGQVFYQVSGTPETIQQSEEAKQVEEVKIPEEDIRFVMEQTGASYEKAREALLKTRGDILQAIMILREG